MMESKKEDRQQQEEEPSDLDSLLAPKDNTNQLFRIRVRLKGEPPDDEDVSDVLRFAMC